MPIATTTSPTAVTSSGSSTSASDDKIKNEKQLAVVTIWRTPTTVTTTTSGKMCNHKITRPSALNYPFSAQLFGSSQSFEWTDRMDVAIYLRVAFWVRRLRLGPPGV